MWVAFNIFCKQKFEGKKQFYIFIVYKTIIYLIILNIVVKRFLKSKFVQNFYLISIKIV